ncbi:MAG: hypothetical protein ACOC35_11025, partial [Promethearchaeia archaeon]
IVKKWPVDFERKESKENAHSTEKKYPEVMVKQSSEIYDMDLPESVPKREDYRESREDFELRILQNPKVEVKPLPSAPEGDVEEILYYLKYVIEEDFDMPSIGRAFEMARDNLRKVTLQSELTKKPHQNKMWEMSKTSNIYQKEKAGYGLNKRDKTSLLEKIDSWIEEIKKEREERERLEREKREQEERLKREKEKRKEKLRLEKEKRERERKEQERLTREKKEEEKKKEELEKRKKEKEELKIRAKKETEMKAEKLDEKEVVAPLKLEKENQKSINKPLMVILLLSLLTNLILIIYIALTS